MILRCSAMHILCYANVKFNCGNRNNTITGNVIILFRDTFCGTFEYARNERALTVLRFLSVNKSVKWIYRENLYSCWRV